MPAPDDETFDVAVARLLDEAWTPPRADRPPTLSRGSIETAPSAFQPRQFFEGQREDAAHVGELIRALRGKPVEQRVLDPVLVVPIGQHFYCIDGHHRLLAYDSVGITDGLPVEYFPGSVDDAVAEAVRRNSRNRLPMRNDDKLEAAWRLVRMKRLSKSRIVEASGVSDRTVGNMRAALRDLKELRKSAPSSWREAQNLLRGQERPEFSEEMAEAQAREWARRLGDTFGKQAGKQPDIFADAIELFGGKRLVRHLVDRWIGVAKEVVEAAGEDLDHIPLEDPTV
jgi:hypothetical protein